MARPLRIEFGGACYYVTSRARHRCRVFRDDQDRETFLRQLVDMAESFQVRIRSYCLLSRQFHLFLQTVEPNLSRFLQAFLTAVTVSSNRRRRASGRVFQGRFKALVVEDEGQYRDEVTRLIHLGPAYVAAFRRARLQDRKRAIREYQWSSYTRVLGLQRCPRWLERMSVLASFPGTLAEKQRAYAAHVEKGLVEELWDPYGAATAQTAIGSDEFVSRVCRGLTSVARKASLRRSWEQMAAPRARCRVEDVVKAVAAFYGRRRKTLLRRWSRRNEARQVLLFLAVRHCRGRQSLTELGKELGGLSIAGLSRSSELMAARILHDAELRARVAEIEASLPGGVQKSGAAHG